MIQRMCETAIAAFLIALCFGISGCSRPFAQAEEAVRYQLKDGDSAKFRNERYCGKSDIITGEVNSKNSYGAYAGFEAFFYRNGLVEIGEHAYSVLAKDCTRAMETATAEIVNGMSPEARASWQAEIANEPLLDLNMIDQPDNLDIPAVPSPADDANAEIGRDTFQGE